MMRIVITSIVVCFVAIFATAPRAHAEVIVIGKTTRGGTTSQWLCRDGTYTNLGTATGLNDDYIIQGSGGNDSMEVIRSTRTLSGVCANGGVAWNALVYGTHFLDVVGNGGDDNVFGGAGDTFALGGSGDDFVVNYSSVGKAQGDADADIILGLDGSGDVLRGETGNDCLEDFNDSWSFYDCGDGSDSRANGPTGTNDCETPIACCFC